MKRAEPGTRGGGRFYRVVLRPSSRYEQFRVQDVGRTGHSERLAGRKKSGEWETQAWLISKEDAHVENDVLVPDTAKARDILNRLGKVARRKEGDVFEAAPRGKGTTTKAHKRKMERKRSAMRN